LTTAPSLAPPAGRQGPGPLAARLVEALDLSFARRAGGPLPGEHRAPGVGLGTELAALRAYQPGDDVRRLDAAATARTGEAHVRLDVPERLVTTWLVLDVSPSMAFGTADRLKADVAEGAVRVLARLATRRGGRVALIVCGGERELVLPPHGGRGAGASVERMLGAGVVPDGHGDPRGLERALTRLARMARLPGLVAVVSDFRGTEGLARPLRILCARHSVAAVEVRDPREAELPAVGRLLVTDPETGGQVDVDTRDRRLRERYAERERAGREAVSAELRTAGADHVILTTDAPWLRDLGGRLKALGGRRK
jgi:uncharacterized protein (DUF58 family)